MRKTWLTLIIIIVGGIYLWSGDEAPTTSTNTQLSPQAGKSTYPYGPPVYSTASRSQGLHGGIIPPAGYVDNQSQSSYLTQGEYPYRAPQNSIPSSPFGQSQVHSGQSGYQYGQYGHEQIRTGPVYQYRETDNQPYTVNNYTDQRLENYPQEQALEQQSFFQGTQGLRQQHADVLQPNLGRQQSYGTAARQADEIYPKNRFNPNYQSHISNPGQSGYIFRPLEKKINGPKRWSGNFRENPRSRHYMQPPTRNPYFPEQSPWQQPNQVYNNSSLWAGTALPLKQW